MRREGIAETALRHRKRDVVVRIRCGVPSLPDDLGIQEGQKEEGGGRAPVDVVTDADAIPGAL